MDNRQALKCGSVIPHNGMRFVITGLLGKGGNAIAYTAQYHDSLIEGGIHKCIIKELFPYHPGGIISRGADGSIICAPESQCFYDTHRESFIRGSRLHLYMLDSAPDSVGANFDSFEYNNTVYSVLGLSSIETLAVRRQTMVSLKDITVFIIKLLKAVDVFHKNDLLHLDISPDNIIISEANGEYRVLLIDFNSCKAADGIDGGYISFNSNYSAPELRLGNVGAVSKASDIFSVCAVYAYLIDGAGIRTPARLRRMANTELLRTVPQPAADLLLAILSKGLRSNPKLRYRSAEEMIEACEELIRRIDNVGITHASLWEASHRLCGAPPETTMDNSITIHGGIFPSEKLLALGNTVLTGEGGIGKTTLYKRIGYLNTRRYLPSEPVYFYVPLYRYDGLPDFIKRYIVSKTKFGEDSPTVSDAVKRIDELMDEDHFMALMLDGLNEIVSDCGGLIHEIEELSRKRGVTVSVSERTGARTRELFNDFSRAVLMPLDDCLVRKYLTRAGVPYPDDTRTAELLSNPLMLSLYAKAECVFRASDAAPFSPSTASDVIRGYIACITESCRQSATDDKALQLRTAYVTEILFPALCAQARKRGVLDYKTVRKVCGKDLKRLTGRAFSAAFRKYAGKSREILGGASNADEWTDIAFSRILVSETVLFSDNDGVYRPLHMNFAECLAADHAKNIKRYRRALIGVRGPVIAGALALCIGAGAVTYYYLPGTHPLGSRELRNNYTIMTTIAHSLNHVTQMVLTEENLIELIGGSDTRDALEGLRDAGARLDTLGDAAVDADGLEDLAYRGLDMEQVKKLTSRSAEHRRFQTAMFNRLEHILTLYGEDKLQAELEIYSEYLAGFEKLMGYEICLLTKTISKKGGDVIKEAMVGNGDIVLSFNAALEIDRSDLENSIKSLELELAELASGLGYVQGE